MPVSDPHRALSIVERYEGAINYLYPILLNVSHKHRVLRDETLKVLLAQVGLFNDAAKSNQVSRLHLADAGLATIRGFLRLMADPSRKLLSRRFNRDLTFLVTGFGPLTSCCADHPLREQRKP